MSTEQIYSLLDELPVLRDKKYYYTPAAVFGYIGYRQGFETEVILYDKPLGFFERVLAVVPLEMVVLTIIMASLANSFISRGTPETATDWVPEKNTRKALALLSMIPFAYLLMLHLISLWAIYASKIYTETLIGVAVSIYQLLIIISSVSTASTWIVYALLLSFSKWIHRKYHNY